MWNGPPMPADAFEQLSFDHALTARDIAMARAETNAAPDWKAAAAGAVQWCAANLEDFTADDVLVRLADTGAPSTHNLTALGPVMKNAARAGTIAKTGYVRPSRLARRHARDLTVWSANGLNGKR
jgi:hypothetical protein